MALISSGGEQRISFIVSFTVLTLLFQRSNFCGNFITFLEVLKLLITNYSVNVPIQQKRLTFCLF